MNKQLEFLCAKMLTTTMERGNASKIVDLINEHYDEDPYFINDIYYFSNYLNGNPIFTAFEEIPNYHHFLSFFQKAIKSNDWTSILRLSKCHFLFKSTNKFKAYGFHYLSKAYQNLGHKSIAMIFAKKSFSLYADDIMLGQILENYNKEHSILSDKAVMHYVKHPLGILSFSHAINAAIKIGNYSPTFILKSILDKEPRLYKEKRKTSSLYIYLTGAFFALSKDHLDIAHVMIDKAIARDPEFGDAYFLKGLLELKANNKAYEDFFSMAIENKTRFVWPYYFFLKNNNNLPLEKIKETINLCHSKFDFDLIQPILEEHEISFNENMAKFNHVFNNDFSIPNIVAARFFDNKYDYNISSNELSQELEMYSV